MDRRTDEELLVSARTDMRAFEELYRRHGDRIVSFAARRSRNPQEVVDLVGAIWLEVIASLDRFDRDRGNALPWVFGIAANLCAVDRRRRAREAELVRKMAGRRVLDDDEFARIERQIDAEAVAPRLYRAIEKLPRSERILVDLVIVESLTSAEAAAALGIRPAAARMRLARARRKLRLVAESPHSPAATDPIKEVSS